MRLIKVVLLLVLILFFSLFVTQNYSIISIEFLSYTLTLPAFLLVLVSAFIGFAIPTFYFSIKLISKSKKLHHTDKLLWNFYRGYYYASSRIARSLSHKWEPAAVLYIDANFAIKDYSISLDKLEISKGLVEGYLGSLLLKKGDTELAKEYLKSAIEKDEDNLLALKAYRDLCYLERNIDECVNYQEKILQKCESWDKQHQRAILAELLCMQAELKNDPKEKETLLEKAYDTYKTPFVYFSYITYLLQNDDINIKNAKRFVDKVFKEGIQNQVLLMLSDKEILLTKLLDTIEEYKSSINPEILARVYMKLNMIGKLQQLEAQLENPMRTIVQMHLNHIKESRACKELLLELYKPWKCVCGVEYNLYVPFCDRCNRWGEISLRR